MDVQFTRFSPATRPEDAVSIYAQMDVAELLNLSCALEFSDKVGTDLNLLYYILSCLCFVFVFVFVCACVAIWKPVLSLLLCVHYTLDLRG